MRAAFRHCLGGPTTSILVLGLAGCSELLSLGDFHDPPGAGGAEGGAFQGGAGPGGSGGSDGGDGATAKLQWARSFAGTEHQLAGGVAFGEEGRIVFSGTLKAPMNLEGSTKRGCPATPHQVIPGDVEDPFVAALDADGCAAWSRVFQGGSIAVADDLAARGSEIFFAGTFDGALTIGGNPLSSGSELDVYWARLADDAAGAVLGAGKMAAESRIHGRIAAASNHAVVVARTHTDDIRVEKIDGAAPWESFELTSPGYAEVHAVAVHPDLRIILGGEVGAGLSFGASCGSSLEDSDGDAFVATFNGPTCLWARIYGGEGVQRVTGVAFDGDGSIAVVGTFENEIDFGDGTVISARAGVDAFVVKLDAAGTRQWHRTSDASGDELANAVAVSAKGNIVVAGEHKLDLGFGRAESAQDPFEDGFVLSFDPTGALRWGAVLRGQGIERFVRVAAHDDRVAVLGSHSGSSAWLLGWTLLPAPDGKVSLLLASFEE